MGEARRRNDAFEALVVTGNKPPAPVAPPPQRKIMICIPAGDGKPGSHTMTSVIGAMAEGAALGWNTVLATRDRDSLLVRARDALVSKFWASDCTDMLFVDSDIAWPQGTFTKIMMHQVDFIGGVYRGRGEPAQYVCVPIDDQGINIFYPSGIAEVRGVGTGFLRLTRAAVGRLIDALPPNHWYEDPSEPGLKIYHLFDVTFDHTQEPGMRLRSEDYVLCDRYRAAGGQVYIDSELTLFHLGSVSFEGHFGRFLRNGGAKAEERKLITPPPSLPPAPSASLVDLVGAMVGEIA